MDEETGQNVLFLEIRGAKWQEKIRNLALKQALRGLKIADIVRAEPLIIINL